MQVACEAALGLRDEVVVFGTGRGHSVREVLAAVELVAGAALTVREGPRRRGDVAVAVASPERIGLLPGWQAPHGDLEAIV